ncbi:MAG: nitroreductase family protein [Lachnospiraceae bacterium]|nr:nitroreductase family protein [Lachnospiraceae bacterium]
MNETCKNLTTRRSVRKFKPDQLLETELQEVLAAGMNAPSGMNRQSAVMVVVQDPEIICKLSALNAAVMGKTDIDPFYGAPTVVVVLADTSAPTWQVDGTLVLENLMNEDWGMVIGYWGSMSARQVFESEEGRKLLAQWGLSENYAGIGHCLLGYPDMEPKNLPRKSNYVIRV